LTLTKNNVKIGDVFGVLDWQLPLPAEIERRCFSRGNAWNPCLPTEK